MTDARLPKGRLLKMALVRLVTGFFILLGMLLLPAGTSAYWEAWVYMTVLFVPMIFVLVYLLEKDPGLLERRMRAREKEGEQSLLVKLGLVCCVFVFVLPGFDRRFGWSAVPLAAVIAADAFVLLAYGLFVRVLMENSYASRIVEVEEGQRVITSGPYGIVRHPMYVAILVMFVFTPVALGSWWGVLPALPLVAVLIARIRSEEQVLSNRLEGYPEYARVTRYRLIPGVW